MTVTTTATTEPPATFRALWGERLRKARARLRFVPANLRTRIIAWLVGVVALATLASVVVTYEVLLVRLDHRINSELKQEADELRKLAVGNDPELGKPFGTNARRIFEVYFERNVPSRNEALITFLDGRPFLRSRQVVPYDLDGDPELVARWSSITATDRGEVQTPAGRVEYLAVPLRAEGRTLGVFVAATFVEREQADANAAVRAVAGIGILLLLLGTVLAWRLADRVIRPVTELTRTARTISATDLSARIPAHGRDQVAQLAFTFNEMLDRLERAFRSQRRFVDDAGHELRTPLTIVRGHLELLDDDPQERDMSLALVMDELDRMARIVEDLLLLAKHEQPDFLKLGRVDVATLTDEIHAKVVALAARVWILESIGSGVIVADRQRLTQAIMQLAENAVRYGGGNDEPIVLGSRVANGEARFWVRDHGTGIAPEQQRVIFERFRRGSEPRRSEGAGLGLAIVKAIAEAHDGRVELESVPGEGSCFAIVLPWPSPTTQKGGKS